MAKNIRNRKRAKRMTWEKEITVEGTVFQVTISDDHQALLRAYAKGRAVIGLWNRGKKNQCLTPARYVVESPEDIDHAFLERVVRRRENLPWQIAVTDRLIIREFVPEDCFHIPREPDGGEDSRIFWQEESLKDYIKCQYGFYEYGIWAVVEKMTGRLVGKAGISNMELPLQDTPVELGYHIFSSYRGQGYGKEACHAILHYSVTAVSKRVYARIDPCNVPSVALIKKLGFRLADQTHSGLGSQMCLYVWNCT